jgi:hypothetical protein
VQVLDGASTVIWQFYIAPQIADTAGINGASVIFPVPLMSSEGAALNVKCVTTASSIYVNAQGFAA